VHADDLTVSVLFGTGTIRPEIQELLNSIPQLKLLEQSCDPQKFIELYQRVPSDLVLVEMDGEVQVPEWLEALTQTLPHVPVMVCSHSREPDFLIRAMQVGIREFLPLPLAKPEMEAAVARMCVAKKRLQPVDSSQQGHVIVVTGHKGGVGATTLAVNLTVALGELTAERLALVDLGRPFPDVGNFLDQEASYSISDLIHNLSSLDQSFIQRIMQPYGAKISILHGCADFKDQDFLEAESLEKIFAILRSLYRYVVVDLSHWLDDLFLKVIMEADMVLMLTGLTIPDLRNLKRFWPLLLESHQGLRKIKMVVNRHDKGNGLQLRDLEQITQTPVFDSLPSDYITLLEALNQGAPLGISAPRSKLWLKVKQMAVRVKREREFVSGGVEELVEEKAPKRKFLLF
jgi:pilus assembly protein CpaE